MVVLGGGFIEVHEGFMHVFCRQKKNSQWRENSYKNVSWANLSPLVWPN